MLWEVLVKTNFMVFRVEMKSTFPHFYSSPVHPVVAAAVGKSFPFSNKNDTLWHCFEDGK